MGEPGVPTPVGVPQSGAPGGRAVLTYQRLDGASENKDPKRGLAASKAAFIVLGAASSGSVLDPAWDLGGGSWALAWQPEGGRAEVAMGLGPLRQRGRVRPLVTPGLNVLALPGPLSAQQGQEPLSGSQTCSLT